MMLNFWFTHLDYGSEQGKRKQGIVDVNFEIFEAWRYLDGAQYVMLLRSYSDHAKMTPQEQESLEQDMAEAILDIGGKMPIRDLMDLYIAKKQI